jgi:nucleotide-binding universal stress UspA family protein
MSLQVTPDISIRNILFATDFSSSSEAALRYAIGVSHRYNGLLSIVSVVPGEICDNAQPPDALYFRHSAEKNMAQLLASELFQGIKHQEFIKENEGEGDVARVLSELMRDLQTDLVVLGTHGRGGMKKVLLGSVSEEIVYSALCPVLIVGPGVSPKRIPELALRRILCATDLLPGSAKALAYAHWLAEQEHSRLIVLHVVEMPSDSRVEDREAASDRATKRIKHLVPLNGGLSVDLIVETGASAEQILNGAEGQGADLIVMGSHRTSHPRVAAHLPWMTAHQVLCRARCPVLTVRN